MRHTYQECTMVFRQLWSENVNRLLLFHGESMLQPQSKPGGRSSCWKQRWLYHGFSFCQWTICISVWLNISLAATKESLHTDAQGFAWNPMVWTCRCDQSALVEGWKSIQEVLDDLAADKEQTADMRNQAEVFSRTTAWNDILGRLNSTSISLQDPMKSAWIQQLAC